MAAREVGLGGKVKIKNWHYFSFFDISKNEGAEMTTCSSSFPAALMMLAVHARPTSTRLCSFQFLFSWIFEHMVMAWTLSSPSNPITPQIFVWVHANSTNTVLYTAIENRGPSCVPEEYKI